MAETLRHRGPDSGGVWVNRGEGIVFGHRRLSIIDLTIEGRQPMVSEPHGLAIVFNGEIYNYPDLRLRLAKEGYPFRGRSDTEVLLAAIALWGVDEALDHANGMFAFALWDQQTRALTLARDRLGQKPLYFGWAGRSLGFGSELKAFAAHPEFCGKVDRSALTLFLRHGYVPDPWCIWEGVTKLPPGTYVQIRTEHVLERTLPDPRPYWRVREAAKNGHLDPVSVSDATPARDALDTLLREAVQQCMVSDVPLGAFLSGGIDSSVIVALMQNQSARPVHTFTVGFNDDDFDEARHARRVARHLGTEHTELYVTEADALDVVPTLPSMFDEPFADPSQIPTHLISRLARRHVTVSLSGDGGDELFGGYNRYLWGERLAQAIRWIPRSARTGGAIAAQAIPVSAWDRLARLVPARFRPPQAGEKLHKAALAGSAATPEEAYWWLTSLWQDPVRVVIDADEPRTILSNAEAWPVTEGFLESMMLLDAETYLPGDILTKVDRASMAVGLEARVPFLDHRVVEFAWRLPLAFRVHRGVGKRLLRDLLSQYVPLTLVERPKAGFNVPIHSWLRRELRDWAEDLLDESRMRDQGYLRPEPVRSLWMEHQSGKTNRQQQLWCILMFQAWVASSHGNG